MISCRVVSRHVDAHVDGELDTTTQVEFDSHLASCPHCREEAALTRAIKAETKRALGGARAPDALRRKLLAALEQAPPLAPASTVALAPTVEAEARESAPVNEVPSIEASPPKRREIPRGYIVAARYVVPAAAAAVVFAAFATQRGDGASDTSPRAQRAMAAAMPLFEEVVRRHASEYPAEVHGSEREVSRWFRGRLGFQARPVVFDGGDAELVGARISNVREQDAAAFYYDVDGHRVTVIVFEPPADVRESQMRVGAQRARVGDQDVYYRQVHGYTVPMVQADGLTYAFTGDLDSQSMIQLAAHASPAN